jgi:hypothetical protein
MILLVLLLALLTPPQTPPLSAHFEDTGLLITVEHPQPDACLWLGGPDRPLVQLPNSCGVSSYIVPPNDPSAPKPGDILSLVRSSDDRVMAGVRLHPFVMIFPLVQQ